MISCCTTVAQTTIISLQDYCSSLPTFFPPMLSLLQPEGSMYWSTSQIMLLLWLPVSLRVKAGVLPVPREALWRHLCSHSGLLPALLKYPSSLPHQDLHPCCPLAWSALSSGISVTRSSLPTLFWNVTFSVRPSLATLSKPVATCTQTHTLPFPLGFVFSTYHDLMHYTFFLFITCLPHDCRFQKGRNFVYFSVLGPCCIVNIMKSASINGRCSIKFDE